MEQPEVTKRDNRYRQVELTCFGQGQGIGELEYVLRLPEMATERVTKAIEHGRQSQRHAQMLTSYPYGQRSLAEGKEAV
mgnify:CR=1 FL=1